LGPLLFLIFINDLDESVTDVKGVNLTLFADDTNILVNGNDMQDLALNIDASLKNIFSWFDKNRMLINNEKSLAISFHHKTNKNNILQDIIIKDRQITYVGSYYLFIIPTYAQFYNIITSPLYVFRHSECHPQGSQC
jgi:UDP-N-acetylglucosamine 2-epimerase